MRTITIEEWTLLGYLCGLSGFAAPTLELQVLSMNDGDMGSFSIQGDGNDRRFGRNVAEVTFKDSDGIPVSAALYVDQAGNLFEVDVFKANGTKLNRWPSRKDLERSPGA